MFAEDGFIYSCAFSLPNFVLDLPFVNVRGNSVFIGLSLLRRLVPGVTFLVPSQYSTSSLPQDFPTSEQAEGFHPSFCYTPAVPCSVLSGTVALIHLFIELLCFLHSWWAARIHSIYSLDVCCCLLIIQGLMKIFILSIFLDHLLETLAISMCVCLCVINQICH